MEAYQRTKMKKLIKSLIQTVTRTTNSSSGGSKQFVIVRSDITTKEKQGVQLGHAAVLGFHKNGDSYGSSYDPLKSPYSCPLIYLQVPNKVYLKLIAWYVSTFYRYEVAKFYESGDRERKNNGLTAISFYGNIAEYFDYKKEFFTGESFQYVKYVKGHPVKFLKKWKV